MEKSTSIKRKRLQVGIDKALEKARITRNNMYINKANDLIDQKNALVEHPYGPEGHYGSYPINRDISDDMPLFSASHSQEYRKRTPWYKRIWNRIKAIFVRPKFSKEALEPAEEIDRGGLLENFGMPKDLTYHPVPDATDLNVETLPAPRIPIK